MIKELALSALLMSPGVPTAYMSRVQYLEKHLARDGYDISSIIDDPRFEIYEFGKSRFVNYADTTQSWYMKHDSLEACADFIEEEWKWLKKAEDEFGPSPEHITSVLELETNRGHYTGERPVINSLVSRYMRSGGSRRRRYFGYIKDFLELYRDTTDNIVLPEDIFKAKGSWAGAYGYPQIMPDLFRKYGKDFDGDGVFDAMNMADAIGFISRYLADHGFGKSAMKATHSYNAGHPFYASSIGRHTLALKEIMEKRRNDVIEHAGKMEPLNTSISQPPVDTLMSITRKYSTPDMKSQLSGQQRLFRNRIFPSLRQWSRKQKR